MRPDRFIARLPIRAKLTLAYSAVIALMLAAIGVFLYFHFKAGLDNGLNATLSARADDVSALPREEGVRGLGRRRDLLGGGDLTAQLLSPTGNVLFTSSASGEDEVHRLGVTLNDMLGRLQAARDRERAFVSDASHELRTPLAIVKTEVEVALRTDNPPETLRAALRVVGEEADRLVNLAEDLLLVARSNAGRLDLDCRPVSARRLLEDVERRFRVRAREAGRQIAIQPTGDAAVLADVPRVEQALSNLVDNALRHGTGRSPCGHVPTVTGTSSCMSSTKGRGCLRASYRKPSSGSAAPSGDALEKAAAWGSRSSRSSPPHTAGERTWRTVASARARTPG